MLQVTSGLILPASGKIAALHGRRSTEAMLRLPTAPTKQEIAHLAPIVWLKLGSLATQGITLQVSVTTGVESSRRVVI